ncbi:class I SAM-dependent methyltransferase [Rhodonellum sp.]|uniref:class I SAM-dependent methyltransferase n=1 Tax=Rhodonellum sp. TaxID=2231180 RepID=UPI00271F011A|nr:class I SAM-dependent methyltransferase [Rhodonellum sp.]MDO9553113.1 class I SAM-dependent methyltransferase [Rhodonellum sp.]
MNKILELRNRIYKEKKVVGLNGESLELNSAIDPNEGNAILDILKRNPDFFRTIEIGCAFGLSSLFICEGINGRLGSKHTIIDPFQMTSWKGVGIHNLKNAGIENFNLIEKASEIALPQLLEQKESFDFALIDGWHTFDHTLVDFFYLEKLIRPGGIIGIDDIHLPGINKVVRYLLNYPNLELIESVPNYTSRKRKFRDNILNNFFGLIKIILPKKYYYKVLSDKIIKSDKILGLYSSMVFFRKIDNDKRGWNWFEPF